MSAKGRAEVLLMLVAAGAAIGAGLVIGRGGLSPSRSSSSDLAWTEVTQDNLTCADFGTRSGLGPTTQSGFAAWVADFVQGGPGANC